MFLAVMFLISVCSMSISATEASGTGTESDSEEAFEPVTYTYNTNSAKPTLGYFATKTNGTTYDSPLAEKGVAVISFSTPEEKIATMDLRLQKDGFQIFVDEYSGEVACKDMTSGEVLFTNPYNIASTKGTADIKSRIMSQIHIQYLDNGVTKNFYSFTEASERGQIKVKNIKGGIRVEYTIGREEAKMLVPHLIEATRYETLILDVAEEALKDEGGKKGIKWRKLRGFYIYYSLDMCTTDEQRKALQAQFPILKKKPDIAIYALSTDTTRVEKAKLETLIKTYCPNYTYEELDYDHEFVEYEGEDENPPVFKMALEYSLDENGLSVSLPANGIRFDESRYSLKSVSVLPYMGTGSNPNTGYTFFPDGSGSLFDFEKLASLGSETKFSGKVYGQDYAYQTLTATHQQTIRYPVYGIVETVNLPVRDENGILSTTETYEQDRGFVAIVEEGDSMAEITTYHGGKSHDYNTVMLSFFPRPQDSYNMKDAISVGQNKTWTVVSKRKYTGNYTVRYIMLTDKDVAEKVQHDMPEGEVFEYYECTYLGMANAYRAYLTQQGILKPLTEEDVSEDIPLYINVFGTIETTEKILSIPVDVSVPLTSFEDIQTMYDSFAEQGITNLNFKLTGFTNGGMTHTVPYNLKWEDAAGGAEGFEELIKYAAEKGFKIFPDFDFVYVTSTGLFDGLSLKKHAVKSIDNRYTSRREYSATKQAYVGYYDLCLSPAYFEHFYTKLTENYLKFFGEDYKTAISVGTLGSDLNSDFDEDEPYNREDAKDFTIKAFQYFNGADTENGAARYDYIMTDAGNAYTWAYVDYIMNVPLDSSRFIRASASVPFMGIVLHGSIQFAGTPINMEGNLDYAFLKAIENGASIYFVLSYQNTTKLKEDIRLSQYYSIRYDIWFDDVVEIYNELNSLLSDVQMEMIVGHEFIAGERVPDMSELQDDLDQAILDMIQEEILAADEQERNYIASVLSARQTIFKNNAEVKAQIEELEKILKSIKARVGYTVDDEGNVTFTDPTFVNAVNDFNEAIKNFVIAYNGSTASNKIVSDAEKEINNKANILSEIFNQTKANAVNFYANQAYTLEATARAAYNNAFEAFEYIDSVDGMSDDIRNLSRQLLEETAEYLAAVCSLAPEIYNIAQTAHDYVASQVVEIDTGDVKIAVNTYDTFSFLSCNDFKNSNLMPLKGDYVLMRYVVGLQPKSVAGITRIDISASNALAKLYELFAIKAGETPDFNAVFGSYLKEVENTLAQFELALNNYKEIRELYDNKQATSSQVSELLPALATATKSMNDAMQKLVTAFAGPKLGAYQMSEQFDEATKDQLLAIFYQFSADCGAYQTLVNQIAALETEIAALEAEIAELKGKGEDATAKEATLAEKQTALATAKTDLAAAIVALQTSSDASNNALNAVKDAYTLLAKDVLAGPNGYATAAKSHLELLEQMYVDAQNLYAVLAAKEGVSADLLANAAAYLAHVEEMYNEVKADAEKVLALVDAAYDYLVNHDVYKQYNAFFVEMKALVENDSFAAILKGRLSAELTSYDYVAEDTEDVEDEEEDGEGAFEKYLSDDNNIVLVTYANGKRFILNYCSYAVLIEVDGVVYRIESQSYTQLPAKQ